jgi:hypothetical protein
MGDWLVSHFTIFGVQAQNWMLVALALIAVAIVFAWPSSARGFDPGVLQRQKSAGDEVLTLAGTFDAFDCGGWRSRGRAGLVSRQDRRVLFRRTADSCRLGWSADGALRKSGVGEAASTQKAKEDTNQHSSHHSSPRTSGPS